MFNEQRLETVSRSACVSSAETTITIINTITPTIIGVLIMREREGAGWKGVKDKEKKRKKRERCSFGKRVCVCCFDKSNHSFIQSILKTPLNSTTIPSHNSSSTHTHTHLPHSYPSFKSTTTRVSILNQIPPTSIILPSSSLKSISSSILSLSLSLILNELL